MSGNMARYYSTLICSPGTMVGMTLQLKNHAEFAELADFLDRSYFVVMLSRSKDKNFTQ